MARYERSGYGWNDFLEVEVDGPKLRVRRGRLGTPGVEEVRGFPNPAQAKAAGVAAVKVAKADHFVQAFDLATPPELPPVWPIVELAPVAERPDVAGAACPNPGPGIGDAGRIHQRIWEGVTSYGAARIREGLPLARQARSAALSQRILDIYEAPNPPVDFDAEAEAGALQLLPLVIHQRAAYPWVSGIHAKPTTLARRMIVEGWIARVGLAESIDAFALLGRWRADRHQNGDGFYLSRHRMRDLVSAFVSNADEILRDHLLAALPDECARAMERAAQARANGDLVTRGFLSSAFVDPSWIAADLEERLVTGDELPLTLEATLRAPPALLERWFSLLSLTELMLLEPHENDAIRRLVAAHGARAVPIVGALVRRVAELVALKTGGSMLGDVILERLLDGLLGIALVGPSNHVIAALVSAIHAGTRRSDLFACLRASPAVSLPWIRAAAKHRPSAKMTTLLGQLERVRHLPPADEEAASLESLPKPLQSSTTFDAPPYWKPELLARLRLRSGEAVPLEAYGALGVLLEKGASGLAEVKASCDPASAAAFAWDVFQAWHLHDRERRKEGGVYSKKDEWPMRALAHLGDDETARRLAECVREWPSQGEHYRAVRALDVLVKLGNDGAMLALATFAENVASAGLRKKARAKVAEIAKAKGLTPEELADRLVPTLGLDARATLALDYGPRQFRVGFDAELKPFVRTAGGGRLATLPKPGAKDDAALAAQAQERWKRLKKDARTIASVALPRLERAMGAMRVWRKADFERYVARHPVVGNVARGIVWARVDVSGEARDTFRVAEEGTYADLADKRLELDEEDRIRVVHPSELTPDISAAWGCILADYEELQPFEQLVRSIHALADEERGVRVLVRYEGRTTPTSKVLALLRRGWIRGALAGATADHIYKPLGVYIGAPGVTGATSGTELNAVLRISGFNFITTAEVEREQHLGRVDVSADPPAELCPRPSAVVLGTLHPIVASELLRDLEGLVDPS